MRERTFRLGLNVATLHSQWILSAGITLLGGWLLWRLAAPAWFWLLFGGGVALLWTLPFWFRRHPGPLRSAGQLEQRICAAPASLIHFYSDY